MKRARENMAVAYAILVSAENDEYVEAVTSFSPHSSGSSPYMCCCQVSKQTGGKD